MDFEKSKQKDDLMHLRWVRKEILKYYFFIKKQIPINIKNIKKNRQTNGINGKIEKNDKKNVHLPILFKNTPVIFAFFSITFL